MYVGYFDPINICCCVLTDVSAKTLKHRSADLIQRCQQMLSCVMWATSAGISLTERSSRHMSNEFAVELTTRRNNASKASLLSELNVTLLEASVLGGSQQYPFPQLLTALKAIFVADPARSTCSANERAHLMLYYVWDCGWQCDWQVRLVLVEPVVRYSKLEQVKFGVTNLDVTNPFVNQTVCVPPKPSGMVRLLSI